MRTIIAGSRSITDRNVLDEALSASGWRDEITCVVSGNARGVDRLGEWWATRFGRALVRYPARWDLYGKSAGPIRNRVMAQNADALLLRRVRHE